jgi:hypothetical protein
MHSVVAPNAFCHNTDGNLLAAAGNPNSNRDRTPITEGNLLAAAGKIASAKKGAAGDAPAPEFMLEAAQNGQLERLFSFLPGLEKDVRCSSFSSNKPPQATNARA